MHLRNRLLVTAAIGALACSAVTMGGIMAASAAPAHTANPGQTVHAIADPMLRLINGGFLLGQTPATCYDITDNGGAGLKMTGNGVGNDVVMTSSGNCFSQVQGQFDVTEGQEVYEQQNGDGHCELVNPNNLYLQLTAGCSKGDTWELMWFAPAPPNTQEDNSGYDGWWIDCTNNTCLNYLGLCATGGAANDVINLENGVPGDPDRCIWIGA